MGCFGKIFEVCFWKAVWKVERLSFYIFLSLFFFSSLSNFNIFHFYKMNGTY